MTEPVVPRPDQEHGPAGFIATDQEMRDTRMNVIAGRREGRRSGSRRLQAPDAAGFEGPDAARALRSRLEGAQGTSSST